MTNSVTSWPKLERNLVAILRGIDPAQAAELAIELVSIGFEAIEVPLNSPEPLRSIRLIVEAVPDRVLVGGGTVLTEEDVLALWDCGARLVVSPNVNTTVIEIAKKCAMVTLPGVFTPTEAHVAVAAGASALKFFPANVLGPTGIAAIRTILPAGTIIGVVGGVGAGNIGEYSRIGVELFGFGSDLFRPQQSTKEVVGKARQIVEAYDRALSGLS